MCSKENLQCGEQFHCLMLKNHNYIFAVQTVNNVFCTKEGKQNHDSYGELPGFLLQLLAFFDDHVSLNCQALPTVSCDPVR